MKTHEVVALVRRCGHTEQQDIHFDTPFAREREIEYKSNLICKACYQAERAKDIPTISLSETAQHGLFVSNIRYAYIHRGILEKAKFQYRTNPKRWTKFSTDIEELRTICKELAVQMPNSVFTDNTVKIWVTDIVKETKVPAKVLKKIADELNIHLPLSTESANALRAVAECIGNTEITRLFVSQIPKHRRQTLLDTSDLNKIERYFYGVCMNVPADKKVPGYKAIAQMIRDHIANVTDEEVKYIYYKLRNKITYDRKKRQSNDPACA